MKLEKRAAVLPEEAPVAARLNAIVRRGRAEVSSYRPDEKPTQAPRIQRRFWTPDEISDTMD